MKLVLQNIINNLYIIYSLINFYKPLYNFKNLINNYKIQNKILLKFSLILYYLYYNNS
jgi:hypothetical protein